MTAIEWTDEVWNPVTGCSRVSEGCRYCYIERTPPFRMQGRKLGDPVQLHPERLDAPLRWKKPRRVFVNSLSDLFHEQVPDEFIVAVFGVMAARPDHTFQILTKRPERMLAWFHWIGQRGGFGRYIRNIRPDGDRTVPNYFTPVARTQVVNGRTYRAADDPWISVFNAASFHMVAGRLGNVWLGVSIEDQATANERIPLLLQTPAAVRWVSAEPLLGPVDLREVNPFDDFHTDALDTPDPYYRLNWVVAGGESGPQARPCDVAWIRSIVRQCRATGVPCFVKQLGSYVVDRNDAGFDGDGDDWPMGTDIDDPSNDWSYQGASIRVRLHDRKGGDPSEWPKDLAVRQWPKEVVR